MKKQAMKRGGKPMKRGGKPGKAKKQVKSKKAKKQVKKKKKMMGGGMPGNPSKVRHGKAS
jgi:hypothetical protein